MFKVDGAGVLSSFTSFTFNNNRMEKAYRNLPYFFVGLLMLTFAGFLKTYFALLPGFKGLTKLHHFHGTMMLLWIAMLIAQAILIKYKKRELHRMLGKVSYVLVPFILFSMFLIGRMAYLRDTANLPAKENIGLLALMIPDIFGFFLLYILSMVNKNNGAIHMRYIIGTSLLLIGPGLGRLTINYAGASLPTAVQIAHITAIVVCLLLVLYDVKKHRPYKPFVVALLVLSFIHLSWVFRMSYVWQEFAGTFAKTLF
jgi:hypothetical protein